MKEVLIYTDGACSGNPGPGGWGAVLIYNGQEKEISGGEKETTNNRMELTGVITALELLNQSCAVSLYSDSKYVCEAINKGWLQHWVKAGWKRKSGEVKNVDLWTKLLPLLNRHKVQFIWVKGHAENKYNNRCDAMAVAESRKFMR